MMLGKPGRPLMANTIGRLVGAKNSDVVVGPKPGVDVSVVKIGQGRVMISSADPISLIPSIGPEKSAELSVHAVASDVATSGLTPKFAMFDLNLPPSMSDGLLKKYWRSVHKTCRSLGINILGGHTGRFEGCDYTVVGGATMFAFGGAEAYVTSDMARDGNSIIATKSAAIESAAVLSACFPKTVGRSLGTQVLSNGLRLMNKVSTVRDALIAGSTGLRAKGVAAMHDVTEGGIVSAALDLARASDLRVVLHADAIPVYNEVREICELFRMDPFQSLGQGSLLIASRPGHVEQLVSTLKKRKIDASTIGKLRMTGNNVIADGQGRQRTLSYPKEDPYWRAYWKAIKNGLR